MRCEQWLGGSGIRENRNGILVTANKCLKEPLQREGEIKCYLEKDVGPGEFFCLLLFLKKRNTNM